MGNSGWSIPGPLRLERYEEITGEGETTGTELGTPHPKAKERGEEEGDDDDPSPDVAKIEDALERVLSTAALSPKKQQTLWILDMYGEANVAILVSYFAIGVVSKLTQTPVQYYLIEYLDASSTQYSVYNTLHRLPWSLKWIFGMLIDGVPINVYRRKPWLCIGYSAFTVLNLYLFWVRTPGINQTIFAVFGFTCFYVLADVCTDTLTVERSFYESDRKRGSIQSVGFIYRSFGKVIGSIMGTYLFDNGTTWSFDISQIFLLNAMVPTICMSFVVWPLVELASINAVPSTIEQLAEVWRVLQLKAVWQPMAFIYLFSVLQVPNSAWSNFLVWGLGFSDMELGYLTITSSVVGCLGYVSFKVFFFRTSWHQLYIGSCVVSFFFSLLQVMLILRWNLKLGIPDIIFAVGDDAMVALMEALHAMPSVIMFIQLCPHGAEGTTFALLTAAASLAGTVAGDFGSALTDVWDVSNDTLEAGDFSGVLKLTILTSVLQILPIMFIRILPDTREEHALAVQEGKTSFWGGLTLAIVIAASLLFTVLLNLAMLYWDDLVCFFTYCGTST